VKIALPTSDPNLAIELGFPLPPGKEMSNADLDGKVSQYLYFTQATCSQTESTLRPLASNLNRWAL